SAWSAIKSELPYDHANLMTPALPSMLGEDHPVMAPRPQVTFLACAASPIHRARECKKGCVARARIVTAPTARPRFHTLVSATFSVNVPRLLFPARRVPRRTLGRATSATSAGGLVPRYPERGTEPSAS